MRVTASKTGLIARCQWWARPEAEWADTTSDAADRGNRFHAAIARYVTDGAADELFDAKLDIHPLVMSAAAWVDMFGRDRLAAEVAFAYDVATDTAEIIGHNIGRAYGPWQAKGLVCGSADLVAVSRPLRVGYVGDWSTGDGSKKGPQLRALALMLARTEGLTSVTVEALEVSETGVRHVCTETIVRFEDVRPGMPENQRTFEDIAADLAESLAAIATAEPAPGDHCTRYFCPARAACPAVMEVEALIPCESLVRQSWGLAIQNADHAAYLFERAKVVAKVAHDVLEAVRRYVPVEGLTLSDGRVLAVSEGHTRSTFNVAMAKSLLLEKGATETQIEACSPPTPVKGSLRISSAVRSKKKRAA